ncbi:MAG: hypothetical protein IPL26_10105 [Leptospiraceae bacterium]|nr:hypothetical protein [Leptospiraceae bacterium]
MIKQCVTMRDTMIVNRIVFLVILMYQCSLLNDYSAEQRGCNSHDLSIIISCEQYIQRTSEGKMPYDEDIQSCLLPIYLKEQCKKRLRENSIP